MARAYTKGQKRKERRRRAMADAGLPELAPIKRSKTRGRERMAEIASERLDRDADVTALEARCRQLGMKVIKVPKVPEKDTPEDRKARHIARQDRARQLREMRAIWYGCYAGRAMAAQAGGDLERAELWDAIQHMRKVQVAFDRSIGAPKRHAQCLRLLLPIEAMQADASSPAHDSRSEAEKYTQATSALMKLETWLGYVDKDAASICKRCVIDDHPCMDAEAMIRALRCVSDGMKGRKMQYRGVDRRNGTK